MSNLVHSSLIGGVVRMKNQQQTNRVIRNGGEMGELTRNYPWANTSVGAIEDWPGSLLTLVNMILNSRFPMLIFWGKDLITFYNDIFRISLGNNGKHPSSLGQPGKESWAESWLFIGPMIDDIMSGGKAVWYEDQRLPIYREGKMGYAYWNYSFSPVTDDEGNINGVLVTCNETTKAVEMTQKLAKSESQLQNFVREATMGIIVLLGSEMKVAIVNDAYARLIGHSVEELWGKHLFDVIPEAEEEFKPILDQVLSQREPVFLNDKQYTVLDENGQRIQGYLNLVYQPYREESGNVIGVMVVCHDVTAQVEAQQRKEENERMLLSSFNDMMVGIAIVKGSDLRFQLANAHYCQLCGRRPDELVGRPLVEALPELQLVGFNVLMKNVLDTGVPLSAKEVPVQLLRHGFLETFYVDHSYQPQHDKAGQVVSVLILVIDVTEQVLIRKQVEDAKQTLEYAVELSDLGYFNIDLATGIAICSAKIIEWFGLVSEVTTAEEVISHIYPEDREQANAIFQASLIGNDEGRHDVVYRLISQKTGEMMYMRSIGQVKYKNGERINATGIIQNITDQVYYNRRIADSESRFRLLIEEAPIATWLLTGPEMTLAVANDVILQIWGKSHHIIGKPLVDALPDLVTQRFLTLLEKVYTTGETHEVEARRVEMVVNDALVVYYFDYVLKPLRDADNRVYAIMGMAVDVTGQVQARSRIEQAEENLRMAVDSAELGFFSITLAERRFEASARVRELFGFEPEEEMPYEALVSRVHEDYRQPVIEQIKAALSDGSRFDAEYPLAPDGDGKAHWVRTIGTVQRDSNGNRYFSGIFNDITERKLDEIRKNDFISMVSHELKTPLTSLSGYLQFVQMEAAEKEDEFTSGILKKANKQVGKMTTMINGFLNLSRLESGKIQIDKTRFDMADLLHEVEEEILSTTASHKIIFACKESNFVYADRDKIGQVISNLLSNAIKYSPANSTIYVSCTSHKGLAQLSVQDEGIGINPEDRSKLFERYYRVSSNHAVSGFGIGLYLCKEIIDRHQGNIWVESQPGKGATFYFSLPMVE